jgi:hypothetical protein
MRMDRCGQARERPKKHQVDQLFPNDLVSDCRQPKIPTNPNRDTYLAAHAVATLDHERHLAERHILDIIGNKKSPQQAAGYWGSKAADWKHAASCGECIPKAIQSN